MPFGLHMPKPQGLGEVPKNLHGLDVVQYLKWDQDLGKLSVLHPPHPVLGSWNILVIAWYEN